MTYGEPAHDDLEAFLEDRTNSQGRSLLNQFAKKSIRAMVGGNIARRLMMIIFRQD